MFLHDLAYNNEKIVVKNPGQKTESYKNLKGLLLRSMEMPKSPELPKNFTEIYQNIFLLIYSFT